LSWRIALIGSLSTSKPLPKDADVLVTIEDGLDLGRLAAGRRLKGAAQQINLGADIFLADKEGRYLGYCIIGLYGTCNMLKKGLGRYEPAHNGSARR
jgi:hypothetical protein